jgi:hypothetical protein
VKKHTRKFLNKVVDKVERPYYRNLKVYALSEHELKWVLRKLNKRFIHPIYNEWSREFRIEDQYKVVIYVERTLDGQWWVDERLPTGEWVTIPVQ